MTLPDLDFENRLVNIDHQLLRDTEIGYYIETPKTKSGERQVPMVEEAYQAFKRVLANRKNVSVLRLMDIVISSFLIERTIQKWQVITTA